MLAYKYRDGNPIKLENSNHSTLERDLISIEKNYFWAANFDKLNDPCETRTIYEKVKNQIDALKLISGESRTTEALSRIQSVGEEIYGQNRKSVGIYSLSKTYLDELLWAHYANSHYGFCIEYKLDEIENDYYGYDLDLVEIKYVNEPPQIEFTDFRKKYKEQIEKIAGYKSLRWNYEEEVRLVTNISGIYPYNPNSVKAIIFGLRMADELIQKIISRLKGRGLKYYQIIQVPNSYRFDRKEIIDPNGYEKTYLKQVISEEYGKKYEFKIIKQIYNRVMEVGTINIELKERIPLDILNKIAHLIKDEIFFFAKRINMFYYLEGEEKETIAWGVSHFDKGIITARINE